MAVELMRALSASELEYQRYLAREKYLLDERSKKAYAEHKMRLIEEKARKAKEAEAQAKEAEAQAKAELKSIKETVALNLLDVLDDELIAVKTGLDIKEVQKLRSENSK